MRSVAAAKAKTQARCHPWPKEVATSKVRPQEVGHFCFPAGPASNVQADETPKPVACLYLSRDALSLPWWLRSAALWQNGSCWPQSNAALHHCHLASPC